MALEFELRKCPFCRMDKPIFVKITMGKYQKEICMDCHNRQEASGKKHDRNFGTHDPEDMHRLNLE